MKSIKKNIIFGILSWLIPFIAAFPFFSPEEGLVIDKIFFKTIMILVGSTTGAFLLVKYLTKVEKEFLKEGILVGVSWLSINWILDILILIPMSEITYYTYFTEIGLRYFSILIFSIAISYSLKNKSTNNEKN